MEYTSNCCSASIISPDSQGHGRCSECLENCVPDEENNK